MIAYGSGNDNISSPRIMTSRIGEQFLRDDITNELDMPLSSTIVLKRKMEMLYVPLTFENGLAIDALVDSGAYVSEIAQKEFDIIKQQAQAIIFKIKDATNFQTQVGSSQLEKPLSIATLKFDIGEHTSAKLFVVMKNLTGLNIGLHFMRHNSVVIDTTHDLIYFPHLKMQVTRASSGTSAKPLVVLINDSITVRPKTENNQSICSLLIGIEYNRYRDSGGNIIEAASLRISHSISTIIDKKIEVRVTSKTE